MDALLIQISTSYIHLDVRGAEPQLGLYYIAEYAHHQGYDVKIKRYSSCEPIIANLKSLLHENRCSIVGFYVDSENLWTIRRILINLKEWNPDLFVVIGGPQVTGDAKLALKRIPWADCAIVGEGEIPFTELISQKKSGNINLNKISGAAYVDTNKIFHFSNNNNPTPTNLDIYPYPHRENYTLDKDIVFDQISTGRGCIGKCAFCFEGNKKNNALRLRSIENVIDEIDYVVSNLKNKKYLTFLDDTFIIDTNRTEKICNHFISKYNGNIGWFCEARVDVLLRNIHLLPLMKKAGLIRIQLGGESGSQKVLDAYQKGLQVDQLTQAVKAIYDAGIASTYVNFIIGGAFETLETFNETLELAKLLLNIAPGCVEVGSSIFSPYVGTPMRLMPNSYGIKLIDTDLLKGVDGYMPFTETKALKEQKILQLKNIFDYEINQEMNKLMPKLNDNIIMQNYLLNKQFEMATSWFVKCQEIEQYKNYFGAITSNAFLTINQLSNDELKISVPYRTCQPETDGENYLRNVPFVGAVKNTPLEEAVLLLSSGKICFSEIVSILSRKQEFNDVHIMERIYEIYVKFDNEHLIIWKKDL